MNTPELLASAVVGGAAALQVATTALAAFAIHRPLHPTVIQGRPAVTVLRPVCGLENNIEETLRTTFRSSYEAPVEIIFCCDDENDPVVPLIRRLVEEYHHTDATLLVGRDKVSGNPKLNNLVKGWRVASHDYILMVDSNVLLPHDYIQRLFARWTKDTGLVTSPPVGIRPENFAAAVECGFLNTFQDKWQLASDVLDNGYAQGKVLFWRRDVLEAAGGLERLGRDMAEDVASTKAVREQGLKVRLLGEPLSQPVGERDFASVWSRQVRWAKVRRMGFPLLYACEILSGLAVPLVLALGLVASGTLGAGWVLALMVLWFGAEFALAHAADWPRSPRDIAAWVLREVMMPVIWFKGWFGKGFEWRGNAMTSAEVTANAGH